MKRLTMIAAAAVALTAPSLAFAADVSGSWKLTVKVGDMDVPVTCNLTQDATAIGGTCARSDGGETAAQVKGTVAGDQASWGYDVKYQDMPLHLDYKTTSLSATAMAGTISVAGQDGTFIGTK